MKTFLLIVSMLVLSTSGYSLFMFYTAQTGNGQWFVLGGFELVMAIALYGFYFAEMWKDRYYALILAPKRNPRFRGTGSYMHNQRYSEPLIKGDTCWDTDFGSLIWTGRKWISDPQQLKEKTDMLLSRRDSIFNGE